MINTSQTIGFITGGQLGQMMIQSFLPFRQNEKIFVLDGNKNCPCSRYAEKVFEGSSKDYETVLEFGKQCDTIILEFEHVNVQALYELEKLGKKVFCQARYIEIIQNKGIQKQFFIDNNIPTADFICVTNRLEISELSKNGNFEIGFPCMQKTFFDGYDGGGVQKIQSESDISNCFDTQSIIEKCINIQREFSLILGRDQFGTEFRYPLIEQFFHEKTHIVDCITSHCRVSKDIENQIDMIGNNILKAFSGSGLWAIELFCDENGKILVNEIAPRVHNSGHQSIEGNYCSQFEQYMRIALGYHIGNTEEKMPSITVNLLVEENFSGKVKYIGIEKIMKMENISVHLYGKTVTKPNRKMGHVTVSGKTLDECWEKITKIKKLVRVES